eukprot:6122345-Ditylum_brightwellii.AAC.1
MFRNKDDPHILINVGKEEDVSPLSSDMSSISYYSSFSSFSRHLGGESISSEEETTVHGNDGYYDDEQTGTTDNSNGISAVLHRVTKRLAKGREIAGGGGDRRDAKKNSGLANSLLFLGRTTGQVENDGMSHYNSSFFGKKQRRCSDQAQQNCMTDQYHYSDRKWSGPKQRPIMTIEDMGGDGIGLRSNTSEDEKFDDSEDSSSSSFGVWNRRPRGSDLVVSSLPSLASTSSFSVHHNAPFLSGQGENNNSGTNLYQYADEKTSLLCPNRDCSAEKRQSKKKHKCMVIHQQLFLWKQQHIMFSRLLSVTLLLMFGITLAYDLHGHFAPSIGNRSDDDEIVVTTATSMTKPPLWFSLD